MAEATLNDVTKGLQQVSEAIREQTIADGKADPAKFLKEEFVSILSQRRFSKKSIQQGDKIERAEVKRTKREEDSNKKDLGHYKKQSFFQKMSNKLLGGIDDDIVKEKLDSFKQRLDMTEALERLVSFAQGSSDLLKRQNFLEARKAIRDKLKDAANSKLVKSIQTGFRRLGNGIRRIGSAISKIAGALFDKAKDAAKKGLSFLGKLALGGALLFLINFMKGDNFKKIMKYIRNDILPYIADFYTNVLVPLGNNLKKLGGDIVEDFKKFLKGDINFGNTVQLGKDLGDSFLKFAARVLGYDSKDSMFAALSSTVERLKKAMANMMIDAVNKVIDKINESTKGTIIPDIPKITRIGEEQQALEKRTKDLTTASDLTGAVTSQEERDELMSGGAGDMSGSLRAQAEKLKKAQTNLVPLVDAFEQGNIKTGADMRAFLAKVNAVKSMSRVLEMQLTVAKAISEGKTASGQDLTKGAAKVFAERTRRLVGIKTAKDVEKQEKFLANLIRLEGKEAGDQYGQKIKERQKIIADMKRAAGMTVDARSQQNIGEVGKKITNIGGGGTGRTDHGSPVINQLTKAGGIS